MHLLDTDTCIFILKAETEVLAKFAALREGRAFISSVSYHELLYGALHSAAPERHLAALETFVDPLQILPFTASSAKFSAETREYLAKRGTAIGPLDTLIAAHALEHQLILVTANTKEFTRIPDLQIENWKR